MSEQPTASASPGGGKKILGVPRTTFYLALGGAVIIGLAFYWWRNYQAAQQGTSAASGTAATGGNGGVDYSGELSVIQTELEALMQQEGVTTPAGGSSWGNGGGWSGGSGGGSGSGGDWGGGSGDSGSGSSGSSSGSAGSSSTGMNGGGNSGATSSGSSTSSTSSSTSAPAAPSGGKVTSVNNNDATVTWNANGASKWSVKITGPGKINGFTNTVTVPRAVYSGLEAGHTYTVTVTPLSASGTPGPSGNITVVTTK